MKVRKVFLSAFLVGLMFACGGKKDDANFVKTELGFEFKHCTENKTAPKAKVGDILLGELEIRLNDSVVLSSNYGSPDRLFKIDTPSVGSMDEFLLNMHIGDSAIMIAPADSVSKYVGGLVCRSDDKIYFYLKIHQIISQRELSEHDKEVRDNFAKEDSVLNLLVARKYPKAEKKESGLFILKSTVTDGERPDFGTTVRVSYTVSDTTGRVLDTNVKSRADKGGIFNRNQVYEPFEFVLGDDGLIAGWTEAVSYMRQGEKWTVLIPSKLAYGEAGFGAIAPYTPLIFDLELVEVKFEN